MTQHNRQLEIFLAHRAELVDYVARITGCRMRAEDVVQDAYLRFVRTANSKATKASAGYLFRIARNLALDGARRAAMESRYQGEHTLDWLKPAAEPDPDEQVEHGEELRRVTEVLQALPERQRVAVEMYRFSNCTLEEIAARLEVSPPTVHRLIRNAMIRLAASLDNGADMGRLDND